MAYTTVAKVKSMFRNIKFDASSSAVTESEVEKFITDADTWIDAKLNPYYTTPITGTESLKIVDMISKYLAAHTVKTILELTTQSSSKNQEVQSNLRKLAEKMIEELIPHYDGKSKVWTDAVTPLPDAAKKDVAPTGDSGFSYPTVTSPTFTKGGNNW